MQITMVTCLLHADAQADDIPQMQPMADRVLVKVRGREGEGGRERSHTDRQQ